MTFPGGKRFAFTIMDDTDVSTVRNVAPVYQLLSQLGFRTTKTVWPVGCPEGSPAFGTSETLEDPEHLEFSQTLRTLGFEIAFHGATMESSLRERTVRALGRFGDAFGHMPRVYANHAYNREGLYWGAERLDNPLLRGLYRLFGDRPPGHYQGHRSGSPWWWGDFAERITYMRNLTFDEINLCKINPSMPYKDSRRPIVPWWFSASEANDVLAFNRLIAPPAQDQLEREGGVCIVATHLGKGFAQDSGVHPQTAQLLERLSRKPGWFVPVGELLDWLRSQRHGATDLPAAEWRRMQWTWAWGIGKQKWQNLRKRQGKP